MEQSDRQGAGPTRGGAPLPVRVLVLVSTCLALVACLMATTAAARAADTAKWRTRHAHRTSPLAGGALWSFGAGGALSVRAGAVGSSALAGPAPAAAAPAARAAPAFGATGTSTISGTVVAAEGKAPIAGIEACAYATSAEVFAVACAITDANGKYEASGLPGGQYDVEFFAPEASGLNYLTQFYNGKASEAEAEAVTVAEGAVASGVDASLLPGAEISGLLIDGEAKPVAAMQVCALAPAGFRERCALSNSAGEYTLAALASGEYKIEFAVPFGSELNYATQFYNGVSARSLATAVATTAGAPATSGIDATLQTGGMISGTVTSAATKAALAGVLVCAEDAPSGVGRCATTGASGAYTVAGLPTGSYDVEFIPLFEAGGYAPQFYKEAATPAAAEPVVVTAGSTTPDIDAALLSVPVPITKPTILGSAVEGQTLALTQGSWTNAPTSVTDEWGRCNSTGVIESCHTIAVTPTYTLTAADVGSTIRIREKASNAAGGGTPSFSRPTAVVVASAQAGGLPAAGAPPAPLGLGSGVLSSTARVATTAQLKALLASLLAPRGKGAKIGALLKHRGYAVSFASLIAGRLSISWYLVPKGAHVAGAKPLLVAVGKLSTPASGPSKLTIKLTAGGRGLLARGKQVKLTAKGVLAASGRPSLTATRSFTLKR